MTFKPHTKDGETQNQNKTQTDPDNLFLHLAHCKSINDFDGNLILSSLLFLRIYFRRTFMKILTIGLALLTFLTSVLFSTEEESQNNPFFQASLEQPYHLSIGAVLFDQNGRIACHHFHEVLGHKDIYILMRESMENNESPLMTLHRGLKEEFGAVCKPIAFLGNLSGYLPDPNLPFDKTTLYIACQLVQWDPKDRDLADPEAGSTIEWIDPESLIALMEKQGVRFHHRADADESEMIKRAIPYIRMHLEQNVASSN